LLGADVPAPWSVDIKFDKVVQVTTLTNDNGVDVNGGIVGGDGR